MNGQVWETLWAEAPDLADRTPNAAPDLDRLHYAYRFGPAGIYVGRFDCEGRLALVFSNANRVLIDLPLVGRAAYLYGPASPPPSGLSAAGSLQELKQIVPAAVLTFDTFPQRSSQGEKQKLGKQTRLRVASAFARLRRDGSARQEAEKGPRDDAQQTTDYRKG